METDKRVILGEREDMPLIWFFSGIILFEKTLEDLCKDNFILMKQVFLDHEIRKNCPNIIVFYCRVVEKLISLNTNIETINLRQTMVMCTLLSQGSLEKIEDIMSIFSERYGSYEVNTSLQSYFNGQLYDLLLNSLLEDAFLKKNQTQFCISITEKTYAHFYKESDVATQKSAFWKDITNWFLLNGLGNYFSLQEKDSYGTVVLVDNFVKYDQYIL